MKLLLIAPGSFEFAYLVDEQIITTSKSINEVLIELKAKKGIEALIIPAEQTISDCSNSNFSGVELVKHIRLTPELKDINTLPIILLHWHSIDYYITKDQENIFLYSPGIFRYRLPYSKIEFDNNFKPLEEGESLKPYLFGSENDESISEHNFRNEVAIKQFEKCLNAADANILQQKISYKKIFYRNFSNYWETKQINEAKDVKLKILLVDDKANEWEKALKTVFPNLTIDKQNDIGKLKNLLISNIKIDKIEFDNIDKLNQSQVNSFSNKHLKSSFDVVFLDMYFDNSINTIDKSAGFEFLNHIDKYQIDLPVFIFSATTSDLYFLHKQFPFIIGRFIKGFTPLNIFIDKLEDIALVSSLNLVATNANKLECLMQDASIKFCKKLIDNNKRKSILDLDAKDVFQIRLNLKSIISKIHLIVNGYSKSSKKSDVNKNLLEVLGLFGIIQEYRLDRDCPNRFLSDSEKKLVELRNLAFHSNTNLYPNTQKTLNEWNKSNTLERVQKIENAMKKTFDGLLFGY